MNIDNLNETTNTQDLYVLGSQEGESVKYNLDSLDNKITLTDTFIGGG